MVKSEHYCNKKMRIENQDLKVSSRVFEFRLNHWGPLCHLTEMVQLTTSAGSYALTSQLAKMTFIYIL